MKSRTQSERLAVLETEMTEVLQRQGKLLRQQQEILQELARYRGAIGMALLIFSSIGTALWFFKDAILVKLGLKT